MNKFCIVISGLPASGKTTLAKALSTALSIPLVDKDDYLELLFSQRGVGNSHWRQQLSREADGDFIGAAMSTEYAFKPLILVSHWRPAGEDLDFGTPTQWLGQHFSKVIELYCECPVEIAAARFSRRVRHRGHLDLEKTKGQVLRWLTGYSRYLPLNLSSTMTVNTAAGYQLEEVLQQLSIVLTDAAAISTQSSSA